MDKLQAIRGIAFDLDGTLVDSAPGLTSAVDNAPVRPGAAGGGRRTRYHLDR
ncbi:phosphoglycolate phosphatase [Klebsiella pneumoniae subsp. ozaenae]|uniref:Phosphoglycolate phosphatase n=1 Tax=Klebsiella pneumoniae subsp. ozaenae TaxID=574 RepID=A0A377YVX3_KLEPO|nr:phosphoglycolate phosphatase [Klebsiella pneumoniae subsp. ozaenae]